MKYFRVFETESDYTDFVNGNDYVTPNLCVIRSTGGTKCKPYIPPSMSMVNHITYTISDKPWWGSLYSVTFQSEHPVKSAINIGISNGNIVNLNTDYDTAETYLNKDDSVLGISFSGEPFMEEIEDDFFIYKIVIL